MKKVELNQLLDAGVHFGHLTSKRHPNMTPYIFMEKNLRNGIIPNPKVNIIALQGGSPPVT